MAAIVAKAAAKALHVAAILLSREDSDSAAWSALAFTWTVRTCSSGLSLMEASGGSVRTALWRDERYQ